ncbi:MAG: TIGR00725 family protein [Thermodesulfobacteriota bacterium]|nr:TIGR00725 family protein [Thermodesulfobacteriota bacterium]
MTKVIGVIGAGSCDRYIEEVSFKVGSEIAKNKAILVCGGLGGVMEAASKGAKSAGGITVGILPGFTPSEVNPYIDIPIVTGLSHGRNLIIVRTAQVLISIGGSYGTLSEIAFALKLNKPVIGLNTWDISTEIISARDPIDAVKRAMGLINEDR